MGLLSALGKRGLRRLRSGAMFGDAGVGEWQPGLLLTERFLRAENATHPDAGLVFDIHPSDAWRVSSSWIPQEMRGQGQGLALYQRLLDEARRSGMDVESSWALSDNSRRVYAALRRRGHVVDEVPAPEEVGRMRFRVQTDS